MEEFNEGTFDDIHQKIIVFETFLVRRTFGLYYLTWAVAIALFVSLPYFIILTHLESQLDLFLGTYVILYIITVVSATKVSRNIFKKIMRTNLIRLRNEVEKPFKGIYLSLLMLLSVLLSFIYLAHLPDEAFGIGVIVPNVLLLALDIKIFEIMRQFFNNVPPEGYVAVYTFSLSALFSISFFLLTDILSVSLIYYSYMWWLIAFLGWLFSSYYAIYHATDEVINS